jgi:S-adenosylmethionine:tRNA ribosyltransferase-isomerase
MHTDDFDFPLPAELIAQAPLERRDGSRLMHLTRTSGRWAHRQFSDLPLLLRKGDLLVLNDSRVIPARLIGKKVPSGGRVELLLVRPVGELSASSALEQAASGVAWRCLGQASKPIRPGACLQFDAGLSGEVAEVMGGGEYLVRFTSPLKTLEQAIALAGQLPLPPYIGRAPTEVDSERYQTVYARDKGSVAAPTAGLHFTPEVFAALEHRGVERAFVTLDVGPGTFLPVREGDVAGHRMHSERFSVPSQTVDQIERTRRAGGRVIAVGTTVVRTLESFADERGSRAGTGETAIFITPGFSFRLVDSLITNFHLPRSTLIMLVSAFLGRERTLAAYAEAVAQRYRFFSYGDSMFIEGGT